MIPYGRQSISEADIESVVNVLRSDLITQGPVVPDFEQSVADYCGARYGIAVNSATSALHLACKVLDVGPGDIVWTSPITFVASANCARYCGADVDFVDIDPVTFNISPKKLADKLEKTYLTGGRLPKVVIPVHFAGQSCEMAAIAELAKEYGFRIIEDAAHAIGGRYQSEPVGNCRYSDITVFSFHPVKIITTGEGGMAITNDQNLALKMSSLRSHCITRDPNKMTHDPDGPWYYQQIELGFNYRMTDIQAALGLSQLQQLDEFGARRRELAVQYNAAFEGSNIIPQVQTEDTESVYHLYVVRIPAERHKATFEALCEQGVGVNVHYIPVHTQPYYQKLGFRYGDFPEAERYYSEAISLPIFPTMTTEQQDLVVASLRKALKI